MYKKVHKKYFDTLHVNKITDKKTFLKNIQTIFSKKIRKQNNF